MEGEGVSKVSQWKSKTSVVLIELMYSIFDKLILIIIMTRFYSIGPLIPMNDFIKKIQQHTIADVQLIKLYIYNFVVEFHS